MIRVEMLNVSVYEDPERFSSDYARLSSWRKEKVDRMRFPKDKYRSLGAGILLLTALQEAGLTDAAGEIAENPYQKPYYPDIRDRFQFSLSHAGEMAMCISSFSEAGQAVFVGCDIETESRLNPAIPKRFFRPEEYAWIMEPQEAKIREERFTRLWTLKESFVKAAGMGLALPFRQFFVQIRENDEIILEQEAVPGEFRLREEKAPEGYRASVCIRER